MNKKADVGFTFGKIIGFLILLALLIWAIIYFGGLRSKIADIVSNFLG